jgi:protein MpaA
MRAFRNFISCATICILLCVSLSKNTLAVCTEPVVFTAPAYSELKYGKSGSGRDLICYKIEPELEGKEIPVNKVLLSFELHGFEDLYNKDGEVLVNIGNYIVEYFSKNKDKLYDTTLYVICMANPDGLLDGTTNNGKGRCQTSLGIDLNRDFDYKFKHFSTSRYHTLSKPNGSPESTSLRDLVLELKPDIVIDFHGWLNTTIGDKTLAKVFHDKLNLERSCGFSSSTPGYFSAWASTVCKEAMMVEYPKECARKPDNYKSQTINALSLIIKNISKD